MSSVQKTALSLLIAVVVFSVFAIAAFSGLFEYIEARFYDQRMTQVVERRLETASIVIEEQHQRRRERFQAVLEEPAVRTTFRVNQSEADIAARAQLFGRLRQELPAFSFVRFLDPEAERLWYSSLPGDIRAEDDTRREYQPISELEDAESLRRMVLPEDQEFGVHVLPETNQLVYRLRAYDTFDIPRGTALFYTPAGSLNSALQRRSIIGIGDTVAVGPQQTVIINAAEQYAEAVVEGVGEIWAEFKLGTENYPRIRTDEQSYIAFRRSLESGGNAVWLEPESSFLMTDLMRGTLLGAIFLTTFLLVFLLLNLRQDAVVVLSDRVKRFQINLLREYLDSKERVDWQRWQHEIESRKQEVNREIKRGIGKLNPDKEAEIDDLLDRSWDEILSVIGSGSQRHGVSGDDLDRLERIIERIVANTQNVPAMRLETSSTSTGAVSADTVTGLTEQSREAVEPEEVQELDELAEADEADEAMPAETSMDTAQGQEAPAVVEADEAEELEELDELEEAVPAKERDEFHEPESVSEFEDGDEGEQRAEEPPVQADTGPGSEDLGAIVRQVKEEWEVDDHIRDSTPSRSSDPAHTEPGEPAAVPGRAEHTWAAAPEAGEHDVAGIQAEADDDHADAGDQELEVLESADSEDEVPDDEVYELELLEDEPTLFGVRSLFQTPGFCDIRVSAVSQAYRDEIADSDEAEVEPHETELRPLGATEVSETPLSREEAARFHDLDEVENAGGMVEGDGMERLHNTESTEEYEAAPMNSLVSVSQARYEIVESQSGVPRIRALASDETASEGDNRSADTMESRSSDQDDDEVGTVAGVDSLFGAAVSGFEDLSPESSVESPRLRSRYAAQRHAKRIIFTEDGVDYDRFLQSYKRTEGGILKSVMEFSRIWNARVAAIFVQTEHGYRLDYAIGIASEKAVGRVLPSSSAIVQRLLRARRVVLVKRPFDNYPELVATFAGERMPFGGRFAFLPIAFRSRPAYFFLGLRNPVDSLSELMSVAELGITTTGTAGDSSGPPML